MTLRKTFTTAASVLGLLSFSACAYSAPVDTAAAPVEETSQGPAIWSVSDADTTIYLFGTVHALPEGVEWYDEEISNALAASDTVVTEILPEEMNDPASQMAIARNAMLPADQSLRDLLNEEDRTAYENALGTLGMPPGAFDRFEPWFAGMTMAVLPLLKQGYDPESGVEKIIDTNAGTERKREAFETLAGQIAIFDNLPQDAQIEFLMTSARNPNAMIEMVDEMVAQWMEGDVDELAEIMNAGLADEALASALLYDRNANWAEWIDDRMDQPGTVFVAVGAGHLAGEKSVQSYLETRGIPVNRLR